MGPPTGPAQARSSYAARVTRVMGVLNVTPDSFYDGGRWFDPDMAIRHGLDMVAEGADIVDVG
ncbi:MAG: dihydropteroate synthase, partial [Acidimicrobiales bacterium]